MHLLRRVLVIAVLTCFTFVIVGCDASELDAATPKCDSRCQAEVQWFWASQQTLSRMWMGTLIANTPQAQCVASKESATAGLYGAQNASGASGKYQFMGPTGDSVNRAMGRYDLVGLPAREWAPWDQEAAFGWAWSHYGGAPWSGECGNAPL